MLTAAFQAAQYVQTDENMHIEQFNRAGQGATLSRYQKLDSAIAPFFVHNCSIVAVLRAVDFGSKAKFATKAQPPMLRVLATRASKFLALTLLLLINP